MTNTIGRLSLAGFLALGLLGACEPQDGACILSYEDRDECRPRTSAELCNNFVGTGAGAAKASRFEPVTQEDRERHENLKAQGVEVTNLVCHRLYYTDCHVSGVCRKK